MRAALPLGIVLALAWGTGAAACEVCLAAAGGRISLGDRLLHAEHAVIATAEGGGTLRTVAVVKGDGSAPVGDVRGVAVEGPALLVEAGLQEGWISLGAIEPAEADWLRPIAAGDGDWPERVRRALPRLRDGAHTLSEELAWGEIAAAPYASLAAARGRLDPGEVAGWLNDPQFAPHRAQALLLYGLVGGADDAVRIRSATEAAAAANDARLLGPLLVADLELGGSARLDWIEATYFADRSRTMAEIEGALLALRLQGEADVAVPRDRVVAAFRRLVAARPPLAGSVAPVLAAWGAWDASSDFEALLAAGSLVDPASEFAAQLYVQAARAAADPEARR
jgi:hypothetical protein